MSDFSQISNISEDEYLSDEDILSNEDIQILKQNLTETYITKFFKKKYKLKMKSDESKNSNKISNYEYFKGHEEIDEVKYNLFMIMHNGCKINEEYSSVMNLQNEFRLRRLTSQECQINDKNIIIPGQKHYSFIPKNTNIGKGIIANYEFTLGKDIISIEINNKGINALKINNIPQESIDEKTFISNNNISLLSLIKVLLI